MNITNLNSRTAGYAYLIETLHISAMPVWHVSSVCTTAGMHFSTVHNGIEHEVFRKQYWPGESICDHLEFALKYDGTNLSLLAQIFNVVSPVEITDYIKSRPSGKYARRIWFFFEFITGSRLSIDNLTSGNYIEALDSDKYYTIIDGERLQRYHIVNNMPGSRFFCPLIRKTNKLSEFESVSLRNKCESICKSYPPELLRRAQNYLYKKETKSSFEIEHTKPDTARSEKFIASLMLAEKEDFCEKSRLIELQNRIVDQRFIEKDYRTCQNYVGQTVSYQKEIIHFISPKPEDLPLLMSGLINSHKLMTKGNVPSVIHAAVIAYGFVFLHPFEDGNGRIHRFLIHNILSITGMVPGGLMFPVSAVMVKNQISYDASLEAFSRPLLQLIEYQLDNLGQMTVHTDTVQWYRYMDLTAQAEALYEFVNRTIEDELVEELDFLLHYDTAKKSLQEIIDMPDQKIDLFIQLCIQNNGVLSAKKRDNYFNFINDNELNAMELIVKNCFISK